MRRWWVLSLRHLSAASAIEQDTQREESGVTSWSVYGGLGVREDGCGGETASRWSYLLGALVPVFDAGAYAIVIATFFFAFFLFFHRRSEKEKKKQKNLLGFLPLDAPCAARERPRLPERRERGSHVRRSGMPGTRNIGGDGARAHGASCGRGGIFLQFFFVGKNVDKPKPPFP